MTSLNYLLIFLAAVALGWILQEYDANAQQVPDYKVPIVEFRVDPPEHLWARPKTTTSRLIPQGRMGAVPIDSSRFDHYVPHYEDWRGMAQSTSDKTPTTPLLAGTLPTDRADLVSDALRIQTQAANHRRALIGARIHAIYENDKSIAEYAESLLFITFDNKP